MICVTVYSCMMEEIRIPIHKQMVQLNIYQIHMEVYCKINLLQLDNDKYMYFRVCVRILIDERGNEIDNYNY